MIAVIFEVHLAKGHKQAYLDIATKLKSSLNEVDGFISVERFQSLSDPKKILSLSLFRDEDAVRQWRTLSVHRGAQDKGRNGVFEDYRIRVASVIRDYGMRDRKQTPDDSKIEHDT